MSKFIESLLNWLPWVSEKTIMEELKIDIEEERSTIEAITNKHLGPRTNYAHRRIVMEEKIQIATKNAKSGHIILDGFITRDHAKYLRAVCIETGIIMEQDQYAHKWMPAKAQAWEAQVSGFKIDEGLFSFASVKKGLEPDGAFVEDFYSDCLMLVKERAPEATLKASDGGNNWVEMEFEGVNVEWWEDLLLRSFAVEANKKGLNIIDMWCSEWEGGVPKETFKIRVYWPGEEELERERKEKLADDLDEALKHQRNL